MAQFVTTLHLWNMVLVLASTTITGIWGLFLYFRKLAANRPWRISLTASAVIGVLQGVLGIILVLMGLRAPGGGLYYLHYVYGGIAALGIPVGITYTTGGKNPRRDLLIFSLVALIIAAASVRGAMTGLGMA